MIRWIDAALSSLYAWPIGVLVSASAVSLLFGIIGLWSMWRARRLLAVLPTVQDRLETLSNSLSLLSDTTESCFKALAMQLQFMQSQGDRTTSGSARAASRLAPPQAEAQAKKARQRRVVGAARRGETLTDIAAGEDLAETEVALRLHVSRESQTAAEVKRYGSVLS